MKTILSFVTLHTARFEENKVYLTDVLGFEPTESRPGGTAFVQASGAGLALRSTAGAASGAGVTVSFIVPDLMSYYNRVVGLGALIAEEPHDMPFGKTFVVATPDGHQLGFYEA